VVANGGDLIPTKSAPAANQPSIGPWNDYLKDKLVPVDGNYFDQGVWTFIG